LRSRPSALRGYRISCSTFSARLPLSSTPAAKGRVERAHLTLQDRLVKELRLRGINNVDAANAFAPEFMADYNRGFARAPHSEHDAHRPLQRTEDLAVSSACKRPAWSRRA
jgi:hypothetical protein